MTHDCGYDGRTVLECSCPGAELADAMEAKAEKFGRDAPDRSYDDGVAAGLRMAATMVRKSLAPRRRRRRG